MLIVDFRAQQLLRLAYAHVQMMLYRPFLHYVSQKSNQGKLADKRSYACAAACVSVSRNIIHITSEMRKRGLLVGAYWFTMYTTFFAIISLVYYVLENPQDPGSKQILADANDGKDALKGFAQRSQAADRCSAALLVCSLITEYFISCANRVAGPLRKVTGENKNWSSAGSTEKEARSTNTVFCTARPKYPSTATSALWAERTCDGYISRKDVPRPSRVGDSTRIASFEIITWWASLPDANSLQPQSAAKL